MNKIKIGFLHIFFLLVLPLIVCILKLFPTRTFPRNLHKNLGSGIREKADGEQENQELHSGDQEISIKLVRYRCNYI